MDRPPRARKWYIGVKPNHHADVFAYYFDPTEETHGHLYLFCYGPFRTKRRALHQAAAQGDIVP